MQPIQLTSRLDTRDAALRLPFHLGPQALGKCQACFPRHHTFLDGFGNPGHFPCELRARRVEIAIDLRELVHVDRASETLAPFEGQLKVERRLSSIGEVLNRGVSVKPVIQRGRPHEHDDRAGGPYLFELQKKDPHHATSLRIHARNAPYPATPHTTTLNTAKIDS